MLIRSTGITPLCRSDRAAQCSDAFRTGVPLSFRRSWLCWWQPNTCSRLYRSLHYGGLDVPCCSSLSFCSSELKSWRMGIQLSRNMTAFPANREIYKIPFNALGSVSQTNRHWICCKKFLNPSIGSQREG